MKKILLLLSLGAAITGVSQTPLNYTKINQRYDWLAGKFDSTLTIPFGATTGLKGGGYTGAGALFFNTTTKQFQAYDGTYFRRYMDSAYVSGSDLILRYGNVTQTLAGIGGGGSTDTTSLSLRIDGKESVIDAGLRSQTFQYHTDTFPSVAPASVMEINNGRLIMVFAVASTSLDGVPSYIRNYVRFSDDGGYTWHTQTRIFLDAFEDADSIGISGASFFKTDNGDLHIMVTKVNTPLFQTEYFQTTSTDQGLTWSTPALKFTGGYNAGKTDVVLKASNGTFWLPYNNGNAQPSPEGTYVGHTLKSTNGTTWVDAGVTFNSPDSYPLADPDPGTSLCVENSMLEAEGILYHICRDRTGVVTMWNSTDGLVGEEWTEPYSSGLISPNAMITMKYDSVNKLFIAVHNEVYRGNISNWVGTRLRLMISVSYRSPFNWESVHLVDGDAEGIGTARADDDSGYHFTGHNIYRYRDKLIVGYYAGYGFINGGTFVYDGRQKIVPIEALIPSGKQIYDRVAIQGRPAWWNQSIDYWMKLFSVGVANTPEGYYEINNHRSSGIAHSFSPYINIQTYGSASGLITHINATSNLATPASFFDHYYSVNNLKPTPDVDLAVRSDWIGHPDDPGVATFQTWNDGKLQIRNPRAGNFALSFGIDTTTGSYITPSLNANFSIKAYGGTSIILKPDRTTNLPFLAGTGTRVMNITSGGDVGAITNGTNGQVLMLTSGVPTWEDAGAASAITALTGDVTASGTGSVVATIADASVQINDIDATGTASSTTYLRGDGSWSTPSGGGGVSGLTATRVPFAQNSTTLIDEAGFTYISGSLSSPTQVRSPRMEVNDDTYYNEATVALIVNSNARTYLTNMYDDGNSRLSLTRAGVLNISGLTGTGTRVGLVSSVGNASVLTNGSDGQILSLVSGSPTWSNPVGTLSGLTATRIPFANSSTTLTDNANLTYDGSTLSVPTVFGTTKITGAKLEINNTTFYNEATVMFLLNSTSHTYLFNMYDNGDARMQLTRAGNLNINTGTLTIGTIANEATDVDKFVVSNAGLLKYRTGAEVLSDIGAVPSARTLTINSTAFDLTANRSWTIYGNLLLSTVVEDADYTALTTDYLIVYTSLTAPRTVTLPTAASMSGKTYIIKDEVGSAGTQTITIDGNASETIDGATTKTITSAYGVINIYSNGAAWFTK